MESPAPATRSGLPVPLPLQGRLQGVHPGVFGPKGYPLAVVWIRNHMDLPLHTHDFLELVLVLDGTARHLLPEGGFEIVAGNVFVINPETPHGYACARGLELINILFAPRRLHLPLDDLSSLSGFHALFNLEPFFRVPHRFQSGLFLAPPLRRDMTALAEQLAAELQNREPGYKSMSVALLVRMIVRLSRAYTQLTAPEPQMLLGINRAITYIQNHFEQPVPIGELAARAGTCVRSLQRHFLRAFGVSPVEYVNRLRVKKASELLLETELNITEVADAVGIPDSNYFSRLFRRLAGVSPSVYRQSWRQLPHPVDPIDCIAPRRTVSDRWAKPKACKSRTAQSGRAAELLA